MQRTEKQDIYTRITNQIVSQLEKGVRPWVWPWNAEHAAGRITHPLRHKGKPYSESNVLSLWASAMVQNFAVPIWMTFKQAPEIDPHIRKSEKGPLVVYASVITRTEHDDKTGEEFAREIPYMKGYTVFNVEQIEGLPEIFYANAAPTRDLVARIEHTETFIGSLEQRSNTAETAVTARRNWSPSAGNIHLRAPATFEAADLSCRSTSAGSITKSASARINGDALVLRDGGSKRCSNDGRLNKIVRIVDAQVQRPTI